MRTETEAEKAVREYMALSLEFEELKIFFDKRREGKG